MATTIAHIALNALLSGNPANDLTILAGDNPAQRLSKPIWAARILADDDWRRDDTGIGEAVALWAAIETMNQGSHQRATLPPNVAAYLSPLLTGSGRWNANDGGGHWFEFRRSAIAWLDAGESLRRDVARVWTMLRATGAPARWAQALPEAERLRTERRRRWTAAEEAANAAFDALPHEDPRRGSWLETMNALRLEAFLAQERSPSAEG